MLTFPILIIQPRQTQPDTWFIPATTRPARKVFAHYLPTFPLSIRNEIPSRDYYEQEYLRAHGEKGKFSDAGGMIRERPEDSPWAGKGRADWRMLDLQEEIRRARNAGIDGFDVDVLSATGRNFDSAHRVFQAAERLSAPFECVIKPDMTTIKKPEDVISIVRRLGASTAASRTNDGRIILSPYLADRQSTSWWRGVLDKLQNQGIRVAFVPTFQRPGTFWPKFRSLSFGYSDWTGPARQPADFRIAGVIPQYFRPNRKMVTPTLGSEYYRRMWKSALGTNPDWINVVTWNDYSEATEIAPSSGIRSAFSELTAYYSAWFKAGTPPQITKDAVFGFYRTTLRPSPGEPGGSWKGARQLEDKVELLAFLTAPATLKIEVGSRVFSKEAAAGMTSFLAPAAVGKLRFSIVRSNREVTSAVGRPISKTLDSANFLTHGEFAQSP